ncbi:MAG: hypothetical protein ACRD9Y_11665 [Blastocatellia bacterium]
MDTWDNRTFVSVVGFGLEQHRACEQAVIAVNGVARGVFLKWERTTAVRLPRPSRVRRFVV